jgi:hypothetical protein
MADGWMERRIDWGDEECGPFSVFWLNSLAVAEDK